jgi:hypothetical protein
VDECNQEWFELLRSVEGEAVMVPDGVEIRIIEPVVQHQADECGGKIWYHGEWRGPWDITSVAIAQWGMLPIPIPEPERACRMGDCKGEPVSMCQSNSSE